MDNPASESSSNGALDVSSASNALASYFGGDQGQNESAEHEEKQQAPEAAAERTEEDGANQQADAEGEQQNEGESAAEDEPVTVLVDGKPVQLTKEQIAEAHKGYLRQQDYTRKTMEVAEQRKAADAEAQQARAQRDQYADNLRQILAVNKHHDQESQKWTPETVMEDPVGYQLFTLAAGQRAQQSAEAQAQLQQIEGLQKQEQERAQHDYRMEQQQKLLAKLPEWADPVKAKAEAPKIKQYLAGEGFEEAEIGQINDHRLILMAREAMKYRELMAKAKDTALKVAKAPAKVEAPGRQPVAPTDGRTQGMQRLAKSGRVDDAAALIAQMFK